MTETIAIIDYGSGNLRSAGKAFERAARETGIAIAAIRNANHLGAIAFYADYVARQGLTIIALTISEALVHPYGGRKAMIGTNPVAIGVPATPEPLVLDMATSLVSMGKIHDHANRGAPIPEGWALDVNGNPTTDARAGLAGTMVPLGDAKGTALALMVELLAAGLTGANFASEASSFLDAEGPPPGTGQLLIAIDASAFHNALPRFAAMARSIEPSSVGATRFTLGSSDIDTVSDTSCADARMLRRSWLILAMAAPS